jgi:hypothetical protein
LSRKPNWRNAAAAINGRFLRCDHDVILPALEPQERQTARNAGASIGAYRLLVAEVFLQLLACRL